VEVEIALGPGYIHIMPEHDHLHHADMLAARLGVGLTSTRREVLEHIVEAGQPVTAYQLLDQLQKARGKAVMPPTVYRAINFLMEHGFVHKLESLNAFVACSDLDHIHSGQFVICGKCGHTEELRDEDVTETLRQHAVRLGYAPGTQTIEVRGTCGACQV
jgi:Fur family zinc uptake transcriptional regulator